MTNVNLLTLLQYIQWDIAATSATMARSVEGKYGMARRCHHLNQTFNYASQATARLLGPVQAALLEEICNCGSISAAQKQLGVSYAYAWKLIAAMNNQFSSPLVDVLRRGINDGGANLTPQGHRVLSAFRRLEQLLIADGQSQPGLLTMATSHRSAPRKSRSFEITEGGSGGGGAVLTPGGKDDHRAVSRN